jgi:hypothetical protein
MITESVQPPAYPAMSPRETPIKAPSATLQRPIASETRSPYRIADKRSRPWSSVPRRNRESPPAMKLGGSSESER